MHEFSQLLDAVKSSKDSFEKFKVIFGDFMENLNKSYPDWYDSFIQEVYITAYGPHFSKEMAEKAVGPMTHYGEDETGEHWTLEETTAAARSLAISFNKYNQYDWYFVLNMMYSDNFKLFGKDDPTYLKLARAWLEDEDVSDGKAWRYYHYVVKG